MCGCEKHHDKSKPCTCICPEHGNFQRAYDLAMERYDEIVRLRALLAAHPPEPEVSEVEEWGVMAGLAVHPYPSEDAARAADYGFVYRRTVTTTDWRPADE